MHLCSPKTESKQQYGGGEPSRRYQELTFYYSWSAAEWRESAGFVRSECDMLPNFSGRSAIVRLPRCPRSRGDTHAHEGSRPRPPYLSIEGDEEPHNRTRGQKT
jgi:hypothetical protein